MAKSFSRREFLRSSILGSTAFFISLSPLKALTPNEKQQVNKKATDAAALNKQARLLFYQKKYTESAAVYQQLIAAYPANVSYYDGYAHVLGAQQKTLAVAELYRDGLKNNPKKPVFMQRLSIRIQDLCMGNHKAEQAFVSKYGDLLLFETATQLMLDAIKLQPKNKGLYLNLKDIRKNADNKSARLAETGRSAVLLSADLNQQIETVSAVYKQHWESTRRRRKPNQPTDADAAIKTLKGKTRRELYSLQEKAQRDTSCLKTRKEIWKSALETHLKAKNINQVEKYGMFILAEQITDTDTIGKLRKFYKNKKAHDRMVSLHRYLYINRENIPYTLALANALVFHSNTGTAATESLALLDKIKDYVDTLHPASVAGYYLTRSGALITNGQPADARNCLLEGIRKFDGRGGAAYALLEAYALSFTGDKLTKGEAILKAICGQTVTAIEDDIWPYVTYHINYRKEKGTPTTQMEQLKQYTALAKIQKKMNSAELSTTSAKIAELKTRVHKS